MKYDWSKFGGQPISPQLKDFATNNPGFASGWKIYNDKFRLLPAFLLISGDGIDDELIINFFIDAEARSKGKDKVIHTNVIVNESFRHDKYTLYTGLPDPLKPLYKSKYVKSKPNLVKRYPWLGDILKLKIITIAQLLEQFPNNPRIKIALRRALLS